MFRKSVTMKWQRLKQELLTMPALRFGGINLMMVNVIFGHSVACYMKCAV